MSEEDKKLIAPKDFKCAEESCMGVSFATYKNWVIHQRDSHQVTFSYANIEDSEILKIRGTNYRPCPHCGMKVRNNTDILKHVKGVHLSLRPYSCDVCGKTFSYEQAMMVHKANIHAAAPPKPKYLCTLCGVSFVMKGKS